MSTEIPETATEISCDWLNSVLAEGGHLASNRVVRCLTEMAETQGLSSSLVRVSVELDTPGASFPTSLVAKLRPTSDAVFDRYAKLGFYNREVGFYRDMADVGLPVPACYYASEDDSGSFVLLLEDLGAQRAFQGGADVGLALQQIAGVHARWWDSEELSQYDWCSAANTRSLMTARIEELRGHVDRFVSGNTREMVPRRLSAFMQAWVENYHLLFDFQARSPSTLTHGDFWPGQLSFPDNDYGRVYIVDWQTAGPNTATRDVARIISDGLGGGMPTILEGSLIESYLDALSENGVHQYRRSDFEMDYCLQLAGVLEGWVTHVVGLEESEISTMQPYLDGMVWSFDRHQVIERVTEYLEW